MGSIINGTPKGTSLRGTTPFDVLSVKIGETVSALPCRMYTTNEKKKKKPSKETSPIRGSKPPEMIVMKFCAVVGLPGIVTRAKLDGDRLSHFWVVGFEFHVFH